MERTGTKSLTRYVIAYAVLLVLVSVQFGLSFLDLGQAKMPVIVVLSFTSVLVLALFFMHLLEHSAVARLVIVVGMAFVVLLGGLMVLDVVARTPEAASSPPPLR